MALTHCTHRYQFPTPPTNEKGLFGHAFSKDACRQATLVVYHCDLTAFFAPRSCKGDEAPRPTIRRENNAVIERARTPNWRGGGSALRKGLGAGR